MINIKVLCFQILIDKFELATTDKSDKLIFVILYTINN